MHLRASKEQDPHLQCTEHASGVDYGTSTRMQLYRSLLQSLLWTRHEFLRSLTGRHSSRHPVIFNYSSGHPHA